MKKYLWIVWLILTVLTIFTRVYGIGWGLPFLFHPDERNMAVAASTLSFSTMLDPHFYAYNQLPLYIVFFINLITGELLTVVRATVLLRILSAVASICTVYLWFRLLKKEHMPLFVQIFGVLFFICTPVFIQFAHFGTTESLLIFLFLLCLLVIDNPILLGIALGFSIATKISAIQLLTLPFLYIVMKLIKGKMHIQRAIHYVSLVVFISLIFSIAFSPHILLSYQKTIGALRYESAVGTGALHVFYTQQFIGTKSVLFQLFSIFPYALGLPLFVLSLVGFVYALYKKNRYSLYFFILFLPSAFLYAKWVRFMIYPYVLLLFFAVLAVRAVYRNAFLKIIVSIVLLFHIIIGIAFLEVYSFPDVRIRATDWIVRHIPQGSRILTESANVTDLPLYFSEKYTIASLFLFDVQVNEMVRQQLVASINTSDYIIVPSRRMFANSTCQLQKSDTVWKKCSIVENRNPILSSYYRDLLSEKEYKLVAKITSFPRITFGGRTFFSIPDEQAEETWTVFDHPVVRIYKKR